MAECNIIFGIIHANTLVLGITKSFTQNTFANNYANVKIKERSLFAFPNPSNEALNIKIKTEEKDAKIKLSLCDLLGKEIFSLNSNQALEGEFLYIIPTSNLPDGLYILHYVNNDEIIESIKIRVNH